MIFKVEGALLFAQCMRLYILLKCVRLAWEKYDIHWQNGSQKQTLKKSSNPLIQKLVWYTGGQPQSGNRFQDIRNRSLVKHSFINTRNCWNPYMREKTIWQRRGGHSSYTLVGGGDGETQVEDVDSTQRGFKLEGDRHYQNRKYLRKPTNRQKQNCPDRSRRKSIITKISC